LQNILAQVSKKFLLNVVPDVKVDVVILQQFVPDNGMVPEAHFELPNLAGFIPSCDFSGIFNSVNQNAGKDGIFFATSVKQRNVPWPFHVIMVVPGLSEVLSHGDVGSSGEGLGIFFVERRLQG
jgi:hypothetical protein